MPNTNEPTTHTVADDGESHRLLPDGGRPDEVQFFARIPRGLKNLIDADDRPNKDVAEAALWTEFGGERKSTIDVRIQHRDQNIDRLESEIAALEQELQKEREERASLVEKRESIESETENYQSDLGDLLAVMIENQSAVWPSHPRVEEIAARHHGSKADGHVVVDDLQERAEREEMGIPSRAFRDAAPNNGGGR